MTEHEAVYVYANMAIAGHGFMVVRIWRERVSQPEVICRTDTITNTELISTALNASIGLNDEQAEDLTYQWIGDAHG